MANYAGLCPNCGKIHFTGWGMKKCPSCGTKLYQTRIDQGTFSRYSNREKYDAFKSLFPPNSVEVQNIDKCFAVIFENEYQMQQLLLAKIEADKAKEAALSQILISSGFNFEGYRIVRYSGYISGDDATTIPRVSGVFSANHGQNLTDALVKIRIQALRELKEAAYDLGCNAVIGVDFDYITLEPERAAVLNNSTTIKEDYVICVTANGNAVVIEKI